MLIYITNARVVFPSSPGSISVVFLMFSMCLRSLLLFVYSFKSVIQFHYVASIHLRGHHRCEKWKIRLCSTCRVQKCLWFYEMQVQRMDSVAFEALGTWKQLFVSVWHRLWQRHPAGTWAIHPKSCWIEAQNIYYMIHTSCNWGNMNLIVPIIWMTPSKSSFCDSPLGATFVDSCLLPRSLEEQKVIQNMTCASIISTSLIEVEIFRKNQKYIFTSLGSSE